LQSFKNSQQAGDHLGDIRGRGLFWGIELVQEQSTKKPFDPQFQLHSRIKREAMIRGLMVYPMGGTVDGRYGDHVLLAPPFITSESQINDIASLLVASIDAAIQSL